MTINTNMIKGLGLILIAGAGGGWIAQKIANRKYEAKVKKCEEELQEFQSKTIHSIEDMRTNVRREMYDEARNIIQGSIDIEARKTLGDKLNDRINQLDLESFADTAAKESMEKAISRAQEKLYGEASAQLKQTVKQLAEDTVKDRLKEEMYQVNSRRIIEDSVDRAVRDEVRNTIRDKLKWVNFNSLNDIKGFIL